MGITATDNVLHFSHWAMTDSLDTGQSEYDAFNPKQIDPELNDPEQLTGESI